MKGAIAFGCGLVFSVGLALSGMTQPSKVIGFLDLGGDWDPSLALVMGGALMVLFALRRLTPSRPLFAPAFPTLPDRRVDARLVAGAGLFGVGWGLSGFCPGPAIVSLGAGVGGSLVFAAAMLVGMTLHHALFNTARGADDGPRGDA